MGLVIIFIRFCLGGWQSGLISHHSCFTVLWIGMVKSHCRQVGYARHARHANKPSIPSTPGLAKLTTNPPHRPNKTQVDPPTAQHLGDEAIGAILAIAAPCWFQPRNSNSHEAQRSFDTRQQPPSLGKFLVPFINPSILVNGGMPSRGMNNNMPRCRNAKGVLGLVREALPTTEAGGYRNPPKGRVGLCLGICCF